MPSREKKRRRPPFMEPPRQLGSSSEGCGAEYVRALQGSGQRWANAGQSETLSLLDSIGRGNLVGRVGQETRSSLSDSLYSFLSVTYSAAPLPMRRGPVRCPGLSHRRWSRRACGHLVLGPRGFCPARNTREGEEIVWGAEERRGEESEWYTEISMIRFLVITMAQVRQTAAEVPCLQRHER